MSEGLVGRKNTYTCDRCGGRLVTVDRDAGTTPMAMGCRAKRVCPGTMYSAWYPAGIDEPATHEWYYPSEAELEDEERKAAYPPGVRWHHEQGGLFIRTRTPEEEGE